MGVIYALILVAFAALLTKYEMRHSNNKGAK